MRISSAPMRIAILLHRSLLLEGIYSRISNSSADLSAFRIDAKSQDVLEQLNRIVPSIILVETRDIESVNIQLSKILELFPMVKIFCFDLDRNRINVFSQETLRIDSVDSLVALFQTTPSSEIIL